MATVLPQNKTEQKYFRHNNFKRISHMGN